MIHLPASVRVYLCLSACDMRKSFDSLHALVRDYLELDAYAGHLVVFTSRRRDRLKIIYWDRDVCLQNIPIDLQPLKLIDFICSFGSRSNACSLCWAPSPQCARPRPNCDWKTSPYGNN
jgi:hypothetical protein